jgi:hypothetical protein
MKHALTRLQNFYRDVRTVGNNSVWPTRDLEGEGGANLSSSLPRKVLPPTNFRRIQTQGAAAPHSPLANVQAAEHHYSLSSSGPQQLIVPGGESPNEVSWFSGSLQIKTPKPVTAAAPRPPLIQLPVLPEGVGVNPSHHNKTVEIGRTAGAYTPLVSPGAAAAAGLASFPSLLHGADPSEVLGAARGLGRNEAIEFVTSFIHQGVDAVASSPRAVDSPKAFVQRSRFADYANMGFMTSPKPSLAIVEPRDEYEEILRIAEGLPALRSLTPP